MAKTISYHAACRLFPELRGDELRELAQDIARRGLLNPIVVYHGKILDGRNRYRACQAAQVKPRFVDWSGQGSPVEWVISQNLLRRHLNSSQRAVIALDLLPLLEQEAKERQRLSPGRGKKVAHLRATLTGKATDAAAKVLQTNGTYVENVKAVAKLAPELVKQIRAGRVTVPEATRLVKLPAGERRRVLRQMQGGGKCRAGFKVNGERAPYDFYPTPPQAVRELLKREKFTGNIWEPACGAGVVVNLMRRRGHSVIATDVQAGVDFLLEQRQVCNVVTNPPYKQAQAFVEHAKRMASRKVAMLLHVDFLAGCSRYDLFQDDQFPLKVVYVFARRLQFTAGETAPMPQAWYVWDKRYRGTRPGIEWIEA